MLGSWLNWMLSVLTGDLDGCRLAWMHCWVVWEWWPFAQRSRSWQAGITLGPYLLMVEHVGGGWSVWLRLYYGDVRRCDIPIMADWTARTK